MRRLHVDIETYSEVDIKKGGLFKYAQAPSFQIMLLAYAFDDDEPKILDLTNEELPESLAKALQDPEVVKVAHNAAFEVTCLSRLLPKISIGQWECSMLKASYCGYPASLEAAGQALGLAADKAKLSTGKALIRYFCLPCKPTRSNGFRTRNLPHHEPEKWELFKEYCLGDVRAEQEIGRILRPYQIPGADEIGWFLDYEMNSRGIAIDYELAESAIAVDEALAAEYRAKAEALTGLDNPKSTKQLLDWLFRETGEEVDSVAKDRLPKLIEQFDNDKVTEVLELKKLLSKTSTTKYKAMLGALGEDGRVRGVLQYYGANRTGRWAGRLVQVQNLPRNKMEDLDTPRRLVRERDAEMLKLLYGNVPDVLSQLVRTAFIPKPGHRFVVADYSAIEARIIAWLAGEQWRLDVFNTHGKIYEASAAAMFNIPIEEVTSDLRQKGKIAELALGYQGGPGALKVMGALEMGIQESELKKIVNLWRSSNRKITDLWSRVQESALETIETGRATQAGAVSFCRDGRALMAVLPTGRRLFYIEPRVREGAMGMEIIYKGVNQQTRKWEDQATYGGKLVENITQAVARDCLQELITRMHRRYDVPVMHIHDEVVYEVPEDRDEEILEVCLEEMARPIEWAPGLPLKGAGFIADYYKKE